VRQVWLYTASVLLTAGARAAGEIIAVEVD
jgi:hypothetical protein